MKIRINLWSSRLVHVGSFVQSPSALGSASSFEVPYQVLCVSQLPLRQPCVFPTHFLLGNLSYPSLTNKLLDLPLLPLFRCRYAGLILLQGWLGVGAGRTCDSRCSTIIIVVNTVLQMLRKSNLARNRPIKGFRVEGSGVIQGAKGLGLFARLVTKDRRISDGGYQEPSNQLQPLLYRHDQEAS